MTTTLRAGRSAIRRVLVVPLAGMIAGFGFLPLKKSSRSTGPKPIGFGLSKMFVLAVFKCTWSLLSLF